MTLTLEELKAELETVSKKERELYVAVDESEKAMKPYEKEYRNALSCWSPVYNEQQFLKRKIAEMEGGAK